MSRPLLYPIPLTQSLREDTALDMAAADLSITKASHRLALAATDPIVQGLVQQLAARINQVLSLEGDRLAHNPGQPRHRETQTQKRARLRAADPDGMSPYTRELHTIPTKESTT